MSDDILTRAEAVIRTPALTPDSRYSLFPALVAEIERVRRALGDAWDDGNGTGLDGWIGPGIGDSRGVDDEALRRRDRFLTAALGDGVGHHCEAVDEVQQLRDDVELTAENERLRAGRRIDAAYLDRQRSWSEKTFGPYPRLAGVIDHIHKELVEVIESGNNLSEWVDVVMLALDGACGTGASSQAIIDALAAKLEVNEARVWPDWRTADRSKAIEHVRSERRIESEPSPDLLAAVDQAHCDAREGLARHVVRYHDRQWALIDQIAALAVKDSETLVMLLATAIDQLAVYAHRVGDLS